MRFSHSLLALGLGFALALPAASAASFVGKPRTCGTVQPSGLDADLRELSYLQSLAERSAGVGAFATVTVNVYFLVVTNASGQATRMQGQWATYRAGK
jgi:hypothetical protein